MVAVAVAPPTIRLTPKQERFCLNIFGGMSQREAYVQAGYSGNALPATLDRLAFDLYWSPKISARREQLRQKAEDDSIANKTERQQILTEISRGRLANFIGAGATSEKLKSAALQEITITTTGEGKTLIKSSKVRLHNPMQAIDLLNKMDGIYQDTSNITVNNTNNHVEANIVHFDAGEVAKAILEAARLGLDSGLLGGNGHREDTALLSASTDVQAAPISQPKN